MGNLPIPKPHTGLSEIFINIYLKSNYDFIEM